MEETINTQYLGWIEQNLNWILPLIITIIFSILNTIVAIINLKMVKAQAKFQNDSFCYQLYDRRMKIYTSVEKVLLTIVQSGDISSEQLSEYKWGINDAAFLFGNDVKETLDNIYKAMVELHTVSQKVKHNIESKNLSSEHHKLCDRESELLKRIGDFTLHLNEDFAPYIGFQKYRIEKVKK